MQAISRQAQLRLIGEGYGLLVAAVVGALYQRHVDKVRDPFGLAVSNTYADAAAWVTIFLCLMFLVPTYFLLRTMAQSDAFFAVYSRILLALSVTAPVCFAMSLHTDSLTLGDLCVERLDFSPFVLVLLAMSRVMGRHRRGKRLITWAFAIELLTLVPFVATHVLWSR